MFNADKIAAEVISKLEHHLTWKILQELYFVPSQVYRAHEMGIIPYQQSPILEEIRALCRIANGEVDRDEVDEDEVGEVMETVQGLAEALFSLPLSYHYQIPAEFWKSDLGQVMSMAQAWAMRGEFITLSQAAELVYGANTQATRMRIKRAIERGTLREFVDPKATNPQHDKRVLKHEAEKLIEEDD